MTGEYEVGVQSVVFQSRPLSTIIEGLDAVGIDHVELWDRDLGFDDDEGVIGDTIGALDAAGVNVCGHGVLNLESPEGAREPFAFADRLGADYVTVNYPPARDDITAELIELAGEFDLDVGIHNYSSVHHDDLSKVFSTMADVRDVLGRFEDPRLGLCVDTGHFLVEDVTPEDVITEFGDRINSVHLKDTSEAHIEDVPGAGQLDLASVLGLLEEHADLDAPLVIEYELPADRATESLREAIENVEAAIDR